MVKTKTLVEILVNLFLDNLVQLNKKLVNLYSVIFNYFHLFYLRYGGLDSWPIHIIFRHWDSKAHFLGRKRPFLSL